jgi:hypothetical protein
MIQHNADLEAEICEARKALVSDVNDAAFVIAVFKSVKSLHISIYGCVRKKSNEILNYF